MNYEIKNNILIIRDLSQFNITHILECGQFFRFKKDKNKYYICSANQHAIATMFENKCEIECTNVNYFINFFDLNTDYNKIKNALTQKINFLDNAIQYGYGIRILKQNIFEVFVSFIISANNNIKRIQTSIEKISERFGKKLNGYYAFPTQKELLNASVQDFKECGLGYRAEQLYNAIRQTSEAQLQSFQNLDSNELTLQLQKFSGIGPKVADCIMLFGYGRQDVFPVDTWIEKAYNSFNSEKLTNRKIIRENLVKQFDELSGYAQQYLFYYKRSENK